MSSDSTSNKIATISLVISLLVGGTTVYGFFQNYVDQQKVKETGIREALNKAWDLIGGNNQTTWVDAKSSSPEDYKKFEEARRILEDDVLVIKPNHIRALSILAIHHAKFERYDESLSTVNPLIENNPRNYKLYNIRGNIKLGKKLFEEAIKDFDTSLRINPKHARAYHSMGAAYHLQNNYTEAINYYSKAIQYDVTLAHSYNLRGLANIMLKRYQEAVSDLDIAIKITNRDDFYLNRGAAWYYIKKYEKAKKDFSQAIKLNATPVAYTNRGTVWFKQGNYDAALIDFDNALVLDRDYTDALINKSILLSSSKIDTFRDGKRSIALVKEAESHRTKHEYYNALALAYAEDGQFNKAIHNQTLALSAISNADEAIIADYKKQKGTFEQQRPWRQ